MIAEFTNRCPVNRVRRKADVPRARISRSGFHAWAAPEPSARAVASRR
jgi:hypothetical protein